MELGENPKLCRNGKFFLKRKNKSGLQNDLLPTSIGNMKKNYISFSEKPPSFFKEINKSKNQELSIFSEKNEKFKFLKKISHGLIALTKKFNRETENLDFNILSLPFLDSLKKMKKNEKNLEKINFFAEKLKNSQENKIWNHDFLLKRLADNHELNYTKEELMNTVLEKDWETFLDEYIFAKLHTEYEFSKTGLPNSYKESLTNLSKNLDFEKNKRFFIEGENMKAVQNFIESEEFEQGEKLVWFSPKGSLEDGYLGEEDTSYNFIFVYDKESQEKTKLNIYRNYDNFKKLNNIQSQINSFGEIKPSINQKNIKLNDSEKMISSLTQIKNSINLKDLEKIFFQNEENWLIKKNDLPNLSEKEIEELKPTLEEIKNFYFQNFRKITKAMPDSLETNDGFFQSQKYQTIIEELDLLFTISHQSLLKVIDNHKNQTNQNFNLNNDLNLIFNSLENKEEDKNKNNKINSLLSANLINSSNPLARTLSVGQCGIGTFLPVGLIKNVAGIKDFKTINFKNSSYLIPKEYFTGKGVYKKNGILYGPCGIPLENDPLVTIINNPFSEKKSKKTTNKKPIFSSKKIDSKDKASLDFNFKPSVSLEQFIVGDFYST